MNMADSELFEEAKKGLLQEGLMGFLDSKMKIPTCIKLNPDTYYIEWLEDQKTKTLILCHYLFHNRLDSEGIIGLEIKPSGRERPCIHIRGDNESAIVRPERASKSAIDQ